MARRTFACVTAIVMLCIAGCSRVQKTSDLSRSSYNPDQRATLSLPDARRIINSIQPGRSMVPVSWPGGKRVAVALTFDLDAELVWMTHPGTTSPSSLSRGRYGPRVGLERILRVLEARNIPATFFLPALVLELYPAAVAAIKRTGMHEIGYHGYAHEDVRTLALDEESRTMKAGLDLFADSGLRPRVHRSASWNFTTGTLDLLRKYGFRFDSSLMADDQPYEIMADTLATGIIEFPVDWVLDDWPYFQLEWATPLPGLRDPEEVLSIWREEFEGFRGGGGLFLLTMHPQVIGRWSRLKILERLLDHVDSSGSVWYGTLSQIGEHLMTAQGH